MTRLGLAVGLASVLAACAGTYHPEPGAYNRGVGALDDDHPAEAVRFFKRALERDPGDYRARFNLGVAYEAFGRPDAARAEYEAVAGAMPDNVPARLNLAAMALADGDAAEARRLYEAAATADPDDPRGPSALAQLLLIEGDLDGAEAALTEALRRDPRDPASEYRMGRLLERRDRIDEAIAAYGRALDAAPEDGPSLRRLGALSLAREDWPAAVRWLERATIARRTDRRAWVDLSAAYEGAGRLEDALVAAWEARDLGDADTAAADRARLEHLYLRLADEASHTVIPEDGGGAALEAAPRGGAQAPP